MDRAAFVSQSFDAKKWLNEACAAAPDSEHLDRYLQELEMKLQLAAEDAEQHIYDTSILISSRVPGISSDIGRLRVSLAGMTDSVDALSAKVSSDERQCSAAAGKLKQLDLVKSRMLAARKTLQEASTLKLLYDSLDDVMARGDMTQMLSALSTMRSSLDSLVNVPEFVGISDKVAMLETRVKEMAVPELAKAIKDRRGEEVVRYWDALAQIDKRALAQEAYVRHVCLTMNDAFQSISSSQEAVTEWMPRWHQQLIQFVADEGQWLAIVLPSQQPAMLLQALSVALKGFVKPVLDSLALPESNPRELLKTVSFLLSKTTAATNELRAQFVDTPGTVMSSLTHPLFQPFERFISRYAELEGVVVNEELDQLAAEGPAGSSAAAPPQVVLDALLAAPRAMHMSATAALDRCESQTANLHLPDLLPVLDSALARTISRLEERIRRVAATASAASASISDNEDLQQLLRLPLACEALQKAVADVDAAARVRLSTLAPLVTAATAGAADALEAEVRRAIPDQRAAVVVWRLTEGSISSEKLAVALSGVGDMILPKAFAAFSALNTVAENALLEILSKPCRTALAEITTMSSIWAATGTPSEVALSAPYPSTFATSVGDFLITVPQLLEVLVPEDQPAGHSEGTLATQWLDKVASCIADDLTARVLGIQKLGAKGSMQLATDLEYMCNVITALGVLLPPALGTACTLCSVLPEADFKDMVAAGVADGSLERHACKVLAAMRGVELSA